MNTNAYLVTVMRLGEARGATVRRRFSLWVQRRRGVRIWIDEAIWRGSIYGDWRKWPGGITLAGWTRCFGRIRGKKTMAVKMSKRETRSHQCCLRPNSRSRRKRGNRKP